MAVTLQQIYDELDDLRTDSTSGSVAVASEGLRAINNLLDELQVRHNWEHTQKIFRFRYYPRVTLYGALPTSHKAPRALQPASLFIEQFERIEPSVFDRRTELGYYMNCFGIFEDSTGSYLRCYFAQTKAKSTVVNRNTSLTANGTWTANTSTSDASGISADTIIYHDNTGSLAFDVSVSQSVNNYAEIVNSTITSLDLTDYKNGKLFSQVYIPSVTALTSFTLRFGSSSANYYESTVTTQQDGEAFVVGWNLLGFNKESSTTVGTPVITTVVYLLFRVTYAAGYASQVNFRLGEIFIATYEDMVYRYYSYDCVNDISASTTVARFDGTTDDTLMLPDICKKMIAYGVAAELLEQMGQTTLAKKRDDKYEQLLSLAIEKWPEKTQYTEPPSLIPG